MPMNDQDYSSDRLDWITHSPRSSTALPWNSKYKEYGHHFHKLKLKSKRSIEKEEEKHEIESLPDVWRGPTSAVGYRAPSRSSSRAASRARSRAQQRAAEPQLDSLLGIPIEAATVGKDMHLLKNPSRPLSKNEHTRHIQEARHDLAERQHQLMLSHHEEVVKNAKRWAASAVHVEYGGISPRRRAARKVVRVVSPRHNDNVKYTKPYARLGFNRANPNDGRGFNNWPKYKNLITQAKKERRNPFISVCRGPWKSKEEQYLHEQNEKKKQFLHGPFVITDHHAAVARREHELQMKQVTSTGPYHPPLHFKHREENKSKWVAGHMHLNGHVKFFSDTDGNFDHIEQTHRPRPQTMQ